MERYTKRIFNNYEKEYAYETNLETTSFIDYRKFLDDYSEKSYRIRWKKFEDTELIEKEFLPKSVVDENGNIKLWFLEKNHSNIPIVNLNNKLIRDIYEDEKRIKNFEEEMDKLSKESEEYKKLEEAIQDILDSGIFVKGLKNLHEEFNNYISDIEKMFIKDEIMEAHADFDGLP